jgi:hypothetical protein
MKQASHPGDKDSRRRGLSVGTRLGVAAAGLRVGVSGYTPTVPMRAVWDGSGTIHVRFSRNLQPQESLTPAGWSAVLPGAQRHDAMLVELRVTESEVVIVALTGAVAKLPPQVSYTNPFNELLDENGQPVPAFEGLPLVLELRELE